MSDHLSKRVLPLSNYGAVQEKRKHGHSNNLNLQQKTSIETALTYKREPKTQHDDLFSMYIPYLHPTRSVSDLPNKIDLLKLLDSVYCHVGSLTQT